MIAGDIPQQICEVGRRLYLQGFVAANDGNISVRCDDGAILITPTSVSKGFMTPEILCKLNADGSWRSGGKPSSEAKMHVAIYHARPDVKAIVHAHPCMLTAYSIVETPFDTSILTETMLGLGEIALAPYGAPGTPALAEHVASAARSSDAILMERHGAVTLGKTLEEALFMMESFEHCAHTLFYARQLGTPRPLTQSQQEEIQRIRRDVWGK